MYLGAMMAFDSTQISDDALMVLYANGDAEAAQMLADRHVSRVMAVSYRLLGNRSSAEDVTQEAMLRLWKLAPDWRQGEAKVSTWLYRVASNLCLDLLRKRRGSSLDDIDEPVDETPSAEASLLEQERASALHVAMQSLPDRQRLAVTLRHIEELANPDIADVMDISVEAVESLIARGKRSLVTALADQKTKLGLAS